MLWASHWIAHVARNTGASPGWIPKTNWSNQFFNCKELNSVNKMGTFRVKSQVRLHSWTAHGCNLVRPWTVNSAELFQDSGPIVLWNNMYFFKLQISGNFLNSNKKLIHNIYSIPKKSSCIWPRILIFTILYLNVKYLEKFPHVLESNLSLFSTPTTPYQTISKEHLFFHIFIVNV